MTSSFLYSLVKILSIIFFLNTSYSDQSSFKIDFVEKETKCEPLIKRSITISNNSLNKVCNKIEKIIPDISLFNASYKTLDANVQTLTQHTGYIPIRHSYGAMLFYFFFESRVSKSDPVVLWLNGGPGLGSASSLFYSNGPFHINEDLSLKWNDFGWDKVCNILYVDQPIGTGFSYSSDQRDIRHNSKEVSWDLYDFLQAFFEAHPTYSDNDFYIAGISYSGNTVPLLASLIHKKNKANEGIHINLKGLVITNGDINVKYRFASYPDFVYAHKLISRSSYRLLKKSNKECLSLIQRCQTNKNICYDAYNECMNFYRHVVLLSGNPWKFDVREHNHVNVFDPKMLNFLSLDYVRKALGVDNRTYVARNDQVLHAMRNEMMNIYAGVIPQLLEDKIKVLIFDGEYDLICNWLGNLRSLEALKWSGQDQFIKTKLTSYKVDEKKVGEFKNIGPLTFIKVFDAGHSVTTTKKYVSLQIMKRWMNS